MCHLSQSVHEQRSSELCTKNSLKVGYVKHWKRTNLQLIVHQAPSTWTKQQNTRNCLKGES